MELADKGRWIKEKWGHVENRIRAIVFGANGATAEDGDFLPDFCTGWVVFNVVVVAELLAIVIALVMPRGLTSASTGLDLLFVSVFIQWIALAAAYALLLIITFLVGEIALWILWLAHKIPAAHPDWYGNFHLLNLTVS